MINMFKFFTRIKPKLEAQICPSCSQRVMLYRRKVNKTMCNLLKDAYDTWGHEVVNVRHIGDVTHEFAKLQLWGLIQPEEGLGNWRITNKGARFLSNIDPIAKYALIFNGSHYGFDDNEKFYFCEIVEKPANFDFSEECGA